MKKLQGLFGWVAVIALVAGGIVGFMGYQEKQLLDKGTEQPLKIKLADLLARPTLDNVHLTITDYDWGDGYVVEEKKGSWQIVWMPLVPPDFYKGGAAPQNNSVVRLVVKSFKVKNEQDVKNITANLGGITGVVTNDIHSMDSKADSTLISMYPGADFKKAIVLEAGRAFPSQGGVNAMLFGGLGGVVIGLLCAFLWFQASRMEY